MSQNRLSLDITDAQKTEFNKASSDLANVAKNFNVVIEKEELKALPKISDGRIPFVEKCVEYSLSNPEFLPPFADVPEFQKDLQAFKDIRELARPLRQILDNIENSMMVSGSEAWEAARNYYKSVQHHARLGVPAAQTIYDDLRGLFDAKPNPPEPSPPNS
jgi:hypothetical protein